MTMDVPDGRSESNEVLEALRCRAIHARQGGYAVVAIAAILGVREETVSRWCAQYERGGAEALPGDRTGRPVGSGRLLTAQQEEALQQLIDTTSPQELAIPSALWTRQAVQELLEQQVGLRLQAAGHREERAHELLQLLVRRLGDRRSEVSARDRTGATARRNEGARHVASADDRISRERVFRRRGAQSVTPAHSVL